MAVIEAFLHRSKRVMHGLITPGDFFLSYVDRILNKLFHKKSRLYWHARAKKLGKIFRDGDIYRIGDVKLPLLNGYDDDVFWGGSIYEDTFFSYVNFNDKYDEATFDKCDELLGEGLYGLVNDKVNVTVEPGDVVIDVGSWFGDFAAYASVKGAVTYAFEPSERLFALLQKTAALNTGIIPVKKALSSPEEVGFSTLKGVFADESEKFEITTLDDFVRENNLDHVDFIKSDIEGSERKLLAGAQETLRRFAPKLALCTYHLPDDPEVMEALIKQANPKYNVVQKRKKLFASVPK